MKKVILTIIFLFMFLPLVKAESCDVNKVKIDSITIEDSTGNAVEKNKASIEDGNINLDLSMFDVGDSITYKMLIRNDSNDNLEINEDSFNISSSNYIKYSLNDEDSVLVRANSTKPVYLKVEYENEVPDNMLENDTYNEEKNLVIGLSTLTNPKTGDRMIILVSIALVLSIIIYILVKRGEKTSLLGIVLLMMLVPTITYASCTIDFNVKSNVEISKIAIFDIGRTVNNKMNSLSSHGPVFSFVRSSTLPNNIRALVDSELSEANNIIVPDEEVNELYNDIINSSNIWEEFIIKEINGSINYCYTNNSYEYCEEKNNLLAYLNNDFAIPVFENNSNKRKYLTFNAENSDILLLDEEGLKIQIKNNLLFNQKIDVLKNVLSSDNSDYLIYGWYDEDNSIMYYYCEKEEVYLNRDSSFMFNEYYDLESMPGIENVNTSKVENMESMFSCAGGYQNIHIDLSRWDTSKVTNMRSMFYGSGGWDVYDWSIGDLSNWDVSNVTDMSGMFDSSGYSSEVWNIGDLSNWNTSKVRNMRRMFYGAGTNSSEWNIGNISNWDVSKVTNMSYMFYQSGMYANTINLDLSGWDTSSVTDMSGMFYYTGYQSQSLNINLTNFNTSKVTDMSYMFYLAGTEATTWSIGDLSNWDVSNVIDMNHMFNSAGYNATTWNIGELNNWNVSKVTNMEFMFSSAGSEATEWNIGNINNWNIASVKNISHMFSSVGKNANNLEIDLSNWNTSKVENMDGMFVNYGQNAKNVSINLSGWEVNCNVDITGIYSSAGGNADNVSINLSNWNALEYTRNNNSPSMISFGKNAKSIELNVSNMKFPKLTNMQGMFKSYGLNYEGINIIGLSTWDTSIVTNMSSMFADSMPSATTWVIGDLGSWDVSNVTNMSSMFSSAGKNATEWSIGDLSNWDTSNVTDMSNMFSSAGVSATNIIDIGTLKVYATNLNNFMRNSKNMKATINLYNEPASKSMMFNESSTTEGSEVIVNYTSNVTSIDNIIATKSNGSHVIKGELITE